MSTGSKKKNNSFQDEGIGNVFPIVVQLEVKKFEVPACGVGNLRESQDGGSQVGKAI